MRRLDNIDLRLLRVFVTLAEAGSFSAAQIALNLSQSTLSTHIGALERRLGAPLCARGRKGFRLTPFGEHTLSAARQLFADVETFHARVERSTSQLVGTLKIGVVDGVVTSGQLGLQGAIRQTMAAAPQAFLDLRLGTPHDLELGIAEGRRDVVIGPFAQQAPGVTYVPIYREAQALYCGRDHPLFTVPDEEIDAQGIEDSLFSVRAYRHLEDLYRVNHPRANASAVHMEAQAMLILSDCFIGFLPRHYGDAYARQGMMRALKPQTYQFQSQHFVAYRSADARLELLRLFVASVRAQAGQDRTALPSVASGQKAGTGARASRARSASTKGPATSSGA